VLLADELGGLLGLRMIGQTHETDSTATDRLQSSVTQMTEIQHEPDVAALAQLGQPLQMQVADLVRADDDQRAQVDVLRADPPGKPLHYKVFEEFPAGAATVALIHQAGEVRRRGHGTASQLLERMDIRLDASQVAMHLTLELVSEQLVDTLPFGNAE